MYVCMYDVKVACEEVQAEVIDVYSYSYIRMCIYVVCFANIQTLCYVSNVYNDLLLVHSVIPAM